MECKKYTTAVDVERCAAEVNDLRVRGACITRQCLNMKKDGGRFCGPHSSNMFSPKVYIPGSNPDDDKYFSTK